MMKLFPPCALVPEWSEAVVDNESHEIRPAFFQRCNNFRIRNIGKSCEQARSVIIEP